MAVRYLIKETYQEGPHKGKSYLLRKGGYVTDDKEMQWEDTTYKTEAICARMCRKMYEENELNRRIERTDEKWRTDHGGKPNAFYIYQHQTYEPYAVTV